MFGLEKLFGKKDGGALPQVDKNQLFSLLNKAEFKALMAELQSKLSRDEQKELMRLAQSGKHDEMHEFIKTRIQDWEEKLREAGI